MKNIILFIIFIFCLIFTSFIKNNTRSIEKKIAILNQDIKILYKELDEVKLEYEYITTPEYLSTLSSNYLSEDFENYNKEDIKNFNLQELKNKKYISKLNSTNSNKYFHEKKR